MLASIRYAVSRYGSLARAYQGRGYKFGGIINSPEIAALAENGRPEAVVPLVGRAMDPFAVGVARKLGEMFTGSLTSVDGTNTNDGPYVFQVNLNGRQVAKQIFDDLEQLKRRSTYQNNRSRGEVDY